MRLRSLLSPERARLLERFPHEVRFAPQERTFSSLSNAKAWLFAQGYTCGPTERLEPIGLHRGALPVARWSDLSAVDRLALDGVIVPENDVLGFRDGAALVRLRMEPKRMQRGALPALEGV